MKVLKEKSLLIMQIAASLQILFAFISFFNPFKIGQNVSFPLVAMLGNAGEVTAQLTDQIENAISLNSRIFTFSLIVLVSLLFILMTTILTFRNNESRRMVIGVGVFFGAVLTITFFLLFLDFTELNTQILSAHSGQVDRKMHVFTQIPLGLYLYFILSLVYTVFAYISYEFDFDALWYTVRSSLSNRFKGGVHPPYNKVTRKKAIEMVDSADMMIYPLVQHIGAPCKPLVKVGDYVMIGQKIADSEAPVCAPIHATVSGTVKKIEPYFHPTLNEVMAIVVENDYQDVLDPALRDVQRDYTTMESEEIIGYIREAGIVGMGGASFPTHIKMNSALHKVDTVIINAAECEPYLSSDHRVMLENTAEFVEGIKIIRQALGVRRVYIGIESNKPDAISRLYKVLRKTKIRIVVLATKYPQGGEKQLIKAITGREVPSGKLPADAGCCVFNVDTAVAIYRAVVKGYPLMRRIVTIAGEALERTGNANVRIGTPISSVLQKFGLQEQNMKKLIMGGPMMGTAICHLDAPVVKGTSGLLCLTQEQLSEDYDGNNCIRCGRCITVCPMKLAPNYIGMFSHKNEVQKCKELNAMDCIECGCCSYTCPAKLPLLQHIRIAKQKIREQSKKA